MGEPARLNKRVSSSQSADPGKSFMYGIMLKEQKEEQQKDGALQVNIPRYWAQNSLMGLRTWVGEYSAVSLVNRKHKNLKVQMSAR